MNIMQKLHDALAAVAAVAGPPARVYPNVLPQTPQYPCCSFQFISNANAVAFMNSARRTDFHAQVTLHSEDYAALITLRSAVLLAVEAMPEYINRDVDIEAPYTFATGTFSWILGFEFRDVEQ